MAQSNTEIWGHPRGLSLLFFTEMWERFSYYGMRALFSLYMINALLFSKEKASEIYGSYTGLVYLTPLIGGYVADRYWGNRKSIVLGGLLMALGQFLMFGSASMYRDASLSIPLMWGGLALLIIGNGFFKPNISSMIGQMYTKGDRRRDAAYTIFYMGINLGAFIAPLVCGYLGDTKNPADFKWGFLAAGIGMVLGTILFQTQKDKYVITPEGLPIGAAPNTAVKVSADAGSGGLGTQQLLFGLGLAVGAFLLFRYALSFDTIGALIYAITIAMMTVIITDKSLTKVERDRIFVVYVSAFFVVFFWAAFEQAGASLTFFAQEQTDRSLFGGVVRSSYFQSVNAVAVVLLAPITAAIWVALAKRKSEPNSLIKQALGLLFLALGYVVIAIGVKGVGLGMKVSMFWLIALYVIHTIGELCLSPIGLSLVSKLAPMRFVSLLFGVWFLANSVANKAAGQLSGLYPPSGAEYKLAADNGISTAAYGSLLESNMVISKEASDEAKAAAKAFADTHNGLTLLDYVRKNEIGERLVDGEDTTFTYHFVSLPENIAQKARDKGLEINQMSPELIANLQRLGLTFPTNNYLGTPANSNDAQAFIVTKSTELSLPLNYPTFLGTQIKDLYQFFMLFVGMAGIAGVILFGLSFPLRRLMHGAD